jgi:hypothetical protein
MKKIILLTALLLPVLVLKAQVDSSPNQGKAGVADVADSDPGLFMLMMIILVGLFVAILVSLVGASMLGGFIALLTAAGILSFSVFMGWYKKSIYTGVKWFVYLSFGVAGMAGVLLVCLFIHGIGKTGYPLKTLLAWGIPAGLAGGLLAAWLVLLISRGIYNHLQGKRELQGTA